MPDVLGLRSPVTLPTVDAEICMPLESKREVGFGGSFAPPRLRGIKWFTKVNNHHSREHWLGWGSYHQGGEPEDWRAVIMSAVLRVVAADASDSGLQDIGLAVNESIYDWYLRLRDWLESLAHVDLGHEHAEQSVTGRSEVETAWWVATTRLPGERGYALVNPPLTMQLRDTTHVDRQDWRRAVRETNAGRDPTDSHLLLRDARAAFNRGVFRRCVLDAATAVEVVLSPILTQKVDKSLGSSTRKELVPNIMSVSRKIRALRGLGMRLPASLHSDLFNLRNKVIHEGEAPSRSATRKALETATTVVSAHAPL